MNKAGVSAEYQPAITFTTALALIASAAFLIGAVVSDTRNSIYALIVLALTVPVYLLVKRPTANGQRPTK